MITQTDLGVSIETLGDLREVVAGMSFDEAQGIEFPKGCRLDGERVASFLERNGYVVSTSQPALKTMPNYMSLRRIDLATF